MTKTKTSKTEEAKGKTEEAKVSKASLRRRISVLHAEHRQMIKAYEDMLSGAHLRAMPKALPTVTRIARIVPRAARG